ncbi:DUF1254 domain-containing protein [Lysobacter sp. LF1]|uniref:DUF1254 domain-containing protein n=1 Tax=Lysobacter stagni TaxID=3045172 RepID=A0ABT6XKE9_9GAMM|nr:DUF1254 domain-containing protein [Lysobacter sp. LF1]MDI9240644.1 DUF1254 domain-containing protein [Lysobacter sp. LF1]
MNRLTIPFLASAALCVALVACKREPANESATATTAPTSTPTAAGEPSAEEVRAIARDAYIWGYPVVENYKTLYQQAIDKGGANFHAPLNQIGNSANVATPKDTAIITPNSDTPYSFLWMDLRAEPLVLSIPEMGDKRYFSVQLIDLYTFNFDYINHDVTKGKAGTYLIAGPDWKGETPKGIDKVIRSETPFAYGLFRTQLFDPKDLENVKRLQAQFKLQPLSTFAGTPAPPAAPPVEFPPYDAQKANDLGFFSYLSFLLPYAPMDDSESALRDRLAKIGVVPGKPFDENALSPATRQALLDGIGDANKELEDFVATQVNADKVSSAEMFGTREHLKGNSLYRFAGAKLGIYGNSASEANYQTYFVDAKGQPLDASKHDYVLRFPKDGLPPTNAFWSLTMYDGTSKLLVDNPLNRYLINSPMLGSLKRDADGGITLYLQHASPGKDKETNWLPAPSGSFYVALRNYNPKAEVIDHSWKRPPLETTR